MRIIKTNLMHLDQKEYGNVGEDVLIFILTDC